jgi:hypothetical protein
MKGNSVRNGIVVIILSLIIYIVYDAMMQPGTKDLKGNFTEVAFYRNENNTGPVVRIYAVTVEDTLWEEMKAYGNYMPHTKYGSTKVYFFLKDKPTPDKVFPQGENFDKKYFPYCLALYEKDAMSSVSFRKKPYK